MGFGAESPVRLVVHADQPGAKISPTMYGIFFEDINFGADGGLYAELVKNRSFEFPERDDGLERGQARARPRARSRRWTRTRSTPPARITCASRPRPAGYGIVNEGFAGMGVRKDEDYVFSAYGRDASGKAAVRIELVSPDWASPGDRRRSRASTPSGRRRSATLRPAGTEAKAQLRVLLDDPGTVDLDMVSLFPKKTWKNRPNGLRADLVQWLADLKPGFLRFPGGCIVEGRYLSTRYQWKNTIGKPEERKLIINRWNDEFKHRPAPDYFQTFGLGFYEYFLLCEDIGAEPLPILNCGMACQFNSKELVPLDQLQPYIQDALDLIEFANGPATSTWGRKRAEMGHPKPFNVKYLGVGNEQWGPQYIERYVPFVKALKEKYPEVQLIGATGSDPEIFPNGPEEVEVHAGATAEPQGRHHRRALLSQPRLVLRQRRPLRQLPAKRIEDLRRRVRGPERGRRQPRQPQQLEVRPVRGGVHDRPGTQRRPGHHELLCPPVRPSRTAGSGRPDLIWFDNLQSYGIGQLLRPAVVQPQSRRRGAAGRDQRPGAADEQAAGPVRDLQPGREVKRDHPEGGQQRRPAARRPR